MLHLLRVIILRARATPVVLPAGRGGPLDARGKRMATHSISHPAGPARPRALKCGHLSPIHFADVQPITRPSPRILHRNLAQAPRVRGADAARDHGPDWIIEHPEYHGDLESPEAMTAEYAVERRTNPFLHLSMHLAIAEQLSIDHPPGIRRAYRSWSRAARPPRRPRNHGMPGPGGLGSATAGQAAGQRQLRGTDRQRAER